MKILKLSRTLKEGFVNFCRNGWLSFATVSVLALSLFVVSLVLMLGITANIILKNIETKVNISVYFNPETTEEEIINIKKSLEGFREIQSVEYISKEKALDEFLSDEGENSTIKEALEEIGENPLLSSLAVKAKDPNQYDLINRSISNSEFKDKINRINFEKNKLVIERLNRIINLVEKTGIILGMIFVLISILITFNTIRITIYSHKQEFEIMSLVGASRTYVKMPFIFEGIFYGVSAAIVSIILLLLTVRFTSPLVAGSIPQGNIMGLALQYFFPIFGFLLVFGAGLGVISSLIAIRRYLKI